MSSDILASPSSAGKSKHGILWGVAFVGVVLVLAVAGLVAMGVFNEPPPPEIKPAKPVMTVSLEPATARPMTDRIMVTGSLVPWEDLAVGAEVGQLSIVKIFVEEGDTVTAGQLLAKLDDSLLVAQLKSNEAQIERARAAIGQQDAAIAEAEANARNAQTDLKRAQELLKTATISGQTADTREATARTTMARIDAARNSKLVAQADLALIQSQRNELLARLAQTEIRSPANGVIAKRTARLGKVLSGPSDDLFHVARDGIIELDAEISDRLLPRIKQGQTLNLANFTGQQAPIVGTVRAIAPTVDATTRNGIAHIRFPANPNLRAGSFVTGHLLLEDVPSVTVPESAVVSRDGRSLVFVVDSTGETGTVTAHEVETGLRADGVVAIVKGLALGEKVVTTGTGFLKNGDLVSIVDGLKG